MPLPFIGEMSLFSHSMLLWLFPWESHRSECTGAILSSTDSTQPWGAKDGSTTTAAICWAALTCWPYSRPHQCSWMACLDPRQSPGQHLEPQGPQVFLQVLPAMVHPCPLACYLCKPCLASGQPLAGVIACQWHVFLLVPIIPIAPSSHARARGKEEGSSLQPRLSRHPAACGACQGYSEPRESETSGGEHTDSLCRKLLTAHGTAAFFLSPSNATSGSAVSAFADSFPEGLSRNPISSLAGGRQGLQSDTAELAAGHQLLIRSGSGSICMRQGRGKARRYKPCI